PLRLACVSRLPLTCRTPVLLLLVPMMRLAPPSPLFPYTTLFRSLIVSLALYVGLFLGRFSIFSWLHEPRPDIGVWPTTKFFFVRDRKSTRLNSSHGSISYAVFCLKTKIQI